MSDAENKLDAHFFQLVYGLQMAAMQQMGKIASPLSGKVERNLEAARASIDMLNMLSVKTENNLTPDEKNLLDKILYELKMNFVDESKKGDTPAADKSEESAENSSESSPEKPAESDTSTDETAAKKNIDEKES